MLGQAVLGLDSPTIIALFFSSNIIIQIRKAVPMIKMFFIFNVLLVLPFIISITELGLSGQAFQKKANWLT